MAENKLTADQTVPVKKTNTVLVIIITALMSGGLVGGVVWWLMNNKLDKEVARVQSELNINQLGESGSSASTVPGLDTTGSANSATEDVATGGVVSASQTPAGENFEAAIITGNYQAIEGYLADKVEVVKQATECCGELDKSDVLAELDYLQNAGTFDFDQSQQVVQKLKVNIPGFADDTIGISDKGWVVSYTVNEAGDINSIFMAVSFDMFDLE